MSFRVDLLFRAYSSVFSSRIREHLHLAGDSGLTLSELASQLGLFTSGRLLSACRRLVFLRVLHMRRDVACDPPEWRFWLRSAVSDELAMSFQQEELFTPPQYFYDLDYYRWRHSYDRKFAKVPTKRSRKRWVVQEE